MSSSYAVSQSFNTQSVLWAVAVRSVLPPLWSAVQVLALAAADLALLFSGLVTVLTWCVGIAAIVGALALLLANPAIVLAGLVIVGYAWLTYPRKQVRR